MELCYIFYFIPILPDCFFMCLCIPTDNFAHLSEKLIGVNYRLRKMCL